MKIFNNFTTAKLLQQKGLTSCKNYKLKRTNLPLNTDKNKKNFDKDTSDHKFKICDKVLISNDFYTGKNPKFAPQFKGPGQIIDINDTNAKMKINNKI